VGSGEGAIRLRTASRLTEIRTATDWQAHSVRGFLSTISKMRGLKIESTETESGERTCRIANETRLASRRHLRGWRLFAATLFAFAAAVGCRANAVIFGEIGSGLLCCRPGASADLVS